MSDIFIDETSFNIYRGRETAEITAYPDGKVNIHLEYEASWDTQICNVVFTKEEARSLLEWLQMKLEKLNDD
jgi:hypothetical protein